MMAIRMASKSKPEAAPPLFGCPGVCSCVFDHVSPVLGNEALDGLNWIDALFNGVDDFRPLWV